MVKEASLRLIEMSRRTKNECDSMSFPPCLHCLARLEVVFAIGVCVLLPPSLCDPARLPSVCCICSAQLSSARLSVLCSLSVLSGSSGPQRVATKRTEPTDTTRHDQTTRVRLEDVPSLASPSGAWWRRSGSGRTMAMALVWSGLGSDAAAVKLGSQSGAKEETKRNEATRAKRRQQWMDHTSSGVWSTVGRSIACFLRPLRRLSWTVSIPERSDRSDRIDRPASSGPEAAAASVDAHTTLPHSPWPA